MIEVVFFDAGETLLHPHPSFAELFARVARDHGRTDVQVEDVRAAQERLAPYLIDQNDDSGIEYSSLDAESSRRFWLHLYRRFLDAMGIEDESLVVKLYSTFSHYSSYKLFDDALPAIETLEARGLRLGLISNFERWLEEMLVELEVGHLFEVAVISGIEGVEKPDPRIYQVALERAGVPPDRALHVGDSPVLDVEPALSLGMRAVLLDRYGRGERVDAPRISSLEELPDVVSTL